MEATGRVRDPDQGLSLMSEGNREAGQQAHRELSRHIHNFVASARTLVDHTRVFIKEYYSQSSVLTQYKDQVSLIFSNDPNSKFVHDLRNYMLHKGLPGSQMFLSFHRDPDNQSDAGKIEAGIRLDATSLLEWSGWTAPARLYLETVGKHLDVHQFVESYLVRVNRFHSWLDMTLRKHHQDDLRQLEELQRQLAAERSPPTEITTEESEPVVLAKPFEFTTAQAMDINDTAKALLGNVREMVFAARSPDQFPTQRPISLNITHQNIVGTPTFWGPDVNGKQVFTFIEQDNKLFGFSEPDYRGLDDLANKAFVAGWVREKLSRRFVDDTFIEWARARFSSDQVEFADALRTKAIKNARLVEVWAPVAHLEIEVAFNFGPIRLAPITSDKIDSLKKLMDHIPTTERLAADQFFKDLREDIQGFAAVVVPIEAEPILAEEKGRLIARDVVSLLRFFSPAADAAWKLCPTALVGSEIVPRSKLLLVWDDAFSMMEKVTAKDVAYWRLSRRDLEYLKAQGLQEAGTLVLPDGLSDFATSVRSSLILYGKGLTFSDPIDRLSHTLSAVEGVLLKHELEPMQASVAARMSFLTTKDRNEREGIQQTVRQAYRLKERPRVSILTPREDELLMTFSVYAHATLRTALRNVESVGSKREFITAVDNLGSTQS
ncbi:hypothetical protein [Mesorhizobium sp.]|uniref:hypothetical protein n=1 Tax=Mesorhizobium sp. TaxID=1871066 RepID=UPI0025D396F3|nr:hypothetical protein [Mesorhizobium sp.]